MKEAGEDQEPHGQTTSRSGWEILEGMVEGETDRGRPRATWTNDIKAWTGKRKYEDLMRTAHNRSQQITDDPCQPTFREEMKLFSINVNEQLFLTNMVTHIDHRQWWIHSNLLHNKHLYYLSMMVK